MPNWCSNNLTIRHNDALQIERAVSAFKEQHYLPSFQSIKLVTSKKLYFMK